MGEESLNRNIDLYNKWNNKAGGRIKILFGPQGADFVSPEMLLRIQKAVKERGTKSICMCSKEIERPIRSSSATASVLQLFWMSWAIWMNLLLQSILLTAQMRKLPLLPNEVPQ